MKLRRILCAAMAAMTVSAAVPTNAGAVWDDEKSAALFINEQWFVTETPPIIVNDRTLAPLRDIAETLEFEVDWDQSEKKITVSKDDLTFDLFIDRKYIMLEGQQVEIDSAPILHFDTTMVPVRVISELLSCDVEWNGDRYFVFVNSPKTYEYYKNTPYVEKTYSGDMVLTGYVEKIDYYSMAFSETIPIRTAYQLVAEERGNYWSDLAGMGSLTLCEGVKKIELLAENEDEILGNCIGKRVTITCESMPRAASWSTSDVRVSVKSVELNEIN